MNTKVPSKYKKTKKSDKVHKKKMGSSKKQEKEQGDTFEKSQKYKCSACHAELSTPQSQQRHYNSHRKYQYISYKI